MPNHGSTRCIITGKAGDIRKFIDTCIQKATASDVFRGDWTLPSKDLLGTLGAKLEKRRF